MFSTYDYGAVLQLYGLPLAPDKDIVARRETEVAKLILKMGDKYLLAKPIGKKQ